MHVATIAALNILIKHFDFTVIETTDSRVVYKVLSAEFSEYDMHCADDYHSGTLEAAADELHTEIGDVLGRLARAILDTEVSA